MVTQLQPDVRAYLHGGEVIKRYIRVEEVAHEYGFSVEETEYIAKEDIHYTVVETKAADGYILDETAHDVTLRYDDNAPDVVVATLKLVNVPTEPKLPQTGDNANPLLYLGIGALALITGVGVGLRGRKKKNKQ